MSSRSTRASEDWKRHWPLLRRLLTIAFFILVTVLLVMLARRLDWDEVVTSLRGYETGTLLLAALAALASYALYSTFDLLGRHYCGHQLPARQILPVTFVCYAFNLNLSAWVGGIAFRYRLYSRLGLKKATITKVLSISLLTNWMGYLMLAGLTFSSGLLRLPQSWEIGSTALRLIGVGLLLATLGYFLLCAFSKRRTWSLRGHEISLPSAKLGLLQVLLGAGNWALMALVVFILLPEGVDYPTVLGVLLLASVAGVITHIPAGLGVLETVCITLLAHQVPKGAVLAALIGYRVIYFLVPLLLATLVYLLLEARAKKLRQHNARRGSLEQPSS